MSELYYCKPMRKMRSIGRKMRRLFMAKPMCNEEWDKLLNRAYASEPLWMDL